MSIQTNSGELKLRRKLLGTASAVAALSAFQLPSQALAADAGDTGWHLTLDVGGEYTINNGSKTAYYDVEPNPLVGVASNGGTGWLDLNLETDGWIFGLNYTAGKTGTKRSSFSTKYNTYFSYFANGTVAHNEEHKMLDFTVGQDVGLGMFGVDGSSVLSLGVRWANFSATTSGSFNYGDKYYSSHFEGELHRTFNGIGPVISWAASTPLGGSGSHFSIDWGVSAAVLFGPRKFWGVPNISLRQRNASVPQAAGYLGVGWHPDDTPVTFRLGYAIQNTWGVFDANVDVDGDEVVRNADRLEQGPYLDLTLQLQ